LIRWILWQATLAAEPDSASNALAHTTGSFMTADDPQQFVRVQRVRSKKATSWMEKPQTNPNLIISATMLSPLERMMRSAQRQMKCVVWVDKLFADVCLFLINQMQIINHKS